MNRQRARSRQSVQSAGGASADEQARLSVETEFVGYDHLEVESELLAIVGSTGSGHERVREGDWRFLFDRTPFYAEAGGQVADVGEIVNNARPGRAEVGDVRETLQGRVHSVRVLEGEFRAGDRCRLAVREGRRRAIERAHTATHLLHAALRQTVGEHAIQAGSWVGPEEVRFDFTHFASLSAEERARVEEQAFAAVLADLELSIRWMSMEEAMAAGAMAHFEEEYRGKDRVRVVEVPGVSCELCGGTHVRRTGEIGPLVILAEEAVGTGTRRIRALVGEKGRQQLVSLREERERMASMLGVPATDLGAGVERTLAELREARRRAEALEERLTAVDAAELSLRAEEVNGVNLVGAVVDGGAERAKLLADALASRLGRCAVILGTEASGRAVLVAKVSEVTELSAGDLVRVAAQAVGGRGGGRPTFAQGGGPNADELPKAVEAALRQARAALRSA